MNPNNIKDSFWDYLSKPAQNALLAANIDSIEKLSKFSIKEILKLHGVGKASIPTMQMLLAQNNLSFKS